MIHLVTRVDGTKFFMVNDVTNRNTLYWPETKFEFELSSSYTPNQGPFRTLASAPSVEELIQSYPEFFI